jgi:HSP20 family protein
MALFQFGQGWRPLHDLEREVERMLTGMRLGLPTLRVDRPYPPLNLIECESEYLLLAKVPGMAPTALDLTLGDGVLTLRGTRGRPEGVPDEAFRRHERFWGTWERSVAIPDRVDADRITAAVTDGLLRVRLPKVPESKPRTIIVAGNEGEA